MIPGVRQTDTPDDSGRGIVVLCGISAVGGLVVGLVTGTFRWCIMEANGVRLSLLEHARNLPGPNWLLPMLVVATGAALARYIVRRVPESAGSGVQDVEAIWRGEADAPSLAVLPAKFVGGLLAIGSGLALGREGPTVHMGSVIGSEAARRFQLRDSDLRILQAGLGGAGLAVAFNAPLGGALFVFEEVARSFRIRLALSTLIGCTTAIASSRLILADRADFVVPAVVHPVGWQLAVFFVFGLVTGLLGVLYNRLILGALDLSARFPRVGPEAKAAIIGAVVGLLLFIDPIVVGDGHRLNEHMLAGSVTLASVLGYFLIRFVLGPISYAAGTPGGLFAPLLVVGAAFGVLCSGGIEQVLPSMADQTVAFAIVGMAAMFTAVVRSPLTGIVLISEMTATSTLFLPLIIAVFAALLVTTVMRAEPIYDSLWHRHRLQLDQLSGRAEPEPPPR